MSAELKVETALLTKFRKPSGKEFLQFKKCPPEFSTQLHSVLMFPNHVTILQNDYHISAYILKLGGQNLPGFLLVTF